MSGAIVLHIDRIVLHDMGDVDTRALAAALQQALVDELSSRPIRDPVDLARVQTRMELPEHCGAGPLGRALAQSLHGVLANQVETPAAGRPGKRSGPADA